jgi:hypothetical protein
MKTLIFFERAVPISPNAWYQRCSLALVMFDLLVLTAESMVIC